MSRGQRIQSVLYGLGLAAFSVVLLLSKEMGYMLAAAIIAFSLLVWGMKLLFFYQTMARHMVGGKAMLFLAIFLLDFGVFNLSIVESPTLFIFLYLFLFHGFSGAVGILRAMEERRFQAASWRLKLLTALIHLGVVVAAVGNVLVFHSQSMLLDIYCAGLFYAATERIFAAFRRTEIVYIA